MCLYGMGHPNSMHYQYLLHPIKHTDGYLGLVLEHETNCFGKFTDTCTHYMSFQRTFQLISPLCLYKKNLVIVKLTKLLKAKDFLSCSESFILEPVQCVSTSPGEKTNVLSFDAALVISKVSKKVFYNCHAQKSCQLLLCFKEKTQNAKWTRNEFYEFYSHKTIRVQFFRATIKILRKQND